MKDTDSFDLADAIAIIGMAGRFPGARNIDEFWKNLKNGVESISFFSDDEIESTGLDSDLLKNPRLVKAAGVLDDVKLFDASFFGFSPREAEITDPQQRLFLECAWEALENAGYDAEKFSGLIGVCAGTSMNTYLMNLYSNLELVNAIGPLQIGMANDKDFLATRVSYKLNLKGPSLTVQTACSTSLVAVHLAAQSLLDGQCDMALAGGVSVTVPQKTGYLYQEGGIHSPDGHCRAFDSKGAGFVKGNGVGAVILRRLEDAMADGDNIYAIVRGSAINNDGSVKVGYTAPSELGQAEVIASALAIAGVAPETISYVEAHGTATPIGDPIEVAALTRVFGANGQLPCAIGSVKTNIGHLDAAAGVASLIKTVLALKHKSIPPSLNFELPNPQIDFGERFVVNDKLAEWPASPRRAGVSSFGIGGTNAHVVLEEAPVVESEESHRPSHLLVLSAKTESALETTTTNLAKYLREHDDVNLADVAHTLQVGRKEFAHRRAVTCRDVPEAISALETLDPRLVVTGAHEGSAPPVVFMFSGQGTQYANMGLELYKVEPIFRGHFDVCAELFETYLGVDLRSVIYPREDQFAAASDQLKQTYITQPALFTIEYALAKMWMSWGVQPNALIGHSIGEFVGACLAGVFTIEESVRLVAARGRLMQQMEPGSMLALPLSEDQLRTLIAGKSLSIAAINGPSNCVVSGTTEAIDEFEWELSDRVVAGRRLETSHAFHSVMMEPVVEPFVEEVRNVTLKPPKIPLISNVTGRWSNEEVTDPVYWGKHLRESVRFSQGASELLRAAHAFLEIGPGQSLSTLIRRQTGYSTQTVTATSLRHPQETDSDVGHCQKSLGQLWAAGVNVNWKALYASEERRRVALPGYPFERESYWIDADYSVSSKRATGEKKKDLADWFYVPTWKESLLPPAEGELGQKVWLLFADSYGLTPELAEMLNEQQQDVVVVNSELKNPEDYRALLKELRTAGKSPDVIVHLGNVTPISEVTDSQTTGFFSLLFLAQALGEETLATGIENDSAGRACRILVVSNGLQDVTGGDLWAPEKATLLGPARVIAQEYPHVTCRCIDLALPVRDTRELIARLIAEVTGESDDVVIAYRGNRRWSQTFTPLRLPSLKEPPSRLREGGVYIITGGLGGIGLEMADYLARTVRAKLVLIGRTVLPEKDKWNDWLATHAEHDQTSVRIRRAQRLLSSGAEVLIANADVTNAGELRAVIEKARRSFGAIHGAVHAAGVPGDGLMQLKSPEAAAEVLAPKVEGTLVLAELLKETPLDFFVLCSSIRSIQGGVGHSDYAAANAFLDTFARYQSLNGGTSVQSINWGGWSEVGMSVDYARERSLNSDELLGSGMSAAEGVEAFCRALETSLPQIIVAPQSLEALLTETKQTTQPAATQKSATRAVHQRPRLKDAFVAPQTETEQLIASLWRELLGVETIGINDNFFELGGDSILSLRIIARANHAGLRLSPNDIFKHQTIAELAGVAGTNEVVQTEQGTVTGNIPLTPIQKWFFEQEFIDQHHWNQAVLLELSNGGQPALIEAAIKHLLAHHDALRARFDYSDHRWTQYCDELNARTPVTWIDLSGKTQTEQLQTIESECAQAQTSLDLSAGPLLRVVGFTTEPGNATRLLIVIHHLLTDVVSWRIFLEDFVTAYGQLSTNQTVVLPAKTASYQQWSNHLTELAQSDVIKSDLPYWSEQSRKPARRLPLDFAAGVNTVAVAATISVSLSVAETTALLQEVPSVYRTQITDALLTSLARAVRKWTGERTLLLDMESHGRETNDLDLSRTVGWFTSVFPVVIELDGGDLATNIKSVKEQLRHVPRNGFSYGLLRFLSADIPADRALQPEIGFLYLGQFDQELSALASIKLAEESAGPSQSPKQRRSHLLDFEARVADGKLQVSLTYSQSLHRRATISSLAEAFIEELRALIKHCQSAQEISYSPSDFPDAELNQQELDDLITSLTFG
jgi:non-ribosomal peptide synthase protein (TIGR01720 family)